MHKMSKRRIIKAYQGLQFGSGSPLTSLNPAYSASQGPNFNNAFQFGQRQTQTFGLGTDIQERYMKLKQDFEKFNMGLNPSTSSDPSAKQQGQQLVQDQMDQTNQPNSTNTQQENSTTNIPGAGFDWSVSLNAASSAVAQIPGQVGEIGSKVLKTAGAVKSGIDTIKEASAAAKAGVEGMGKVKGGGIAAIGGAVADLAGSFMPEKTEYAGDKGEITQTMDAVYDGISDAAMAFGPIGMMVGGIMKGGKFLGQGVNALGGGTDGMTTTDAILGSSFFNLTPIGLINGFGGSKTDTITKDAMAFENIGASYTGSERSINDAVHKSGKKYGTFSQGARKEADEEIAEAKRQQSIISTISNEAADRFSIMGSMAAINSNRRKLQMQGDYNQASVRVGRHGMIIQNLQRAKRINSATKYQKGGKTIDPFKFYLQTLPENQRDSSQFRVKDYWDFNGRPKDFDEAVFRGMFTQFEDGWYANSVAENPQTGEIEFMKSSSHPSIQKELDWYDSDDASEFRSQYELQKTEPYFKYVKRKGTNTPQSKQNGGTLDSQVLPEYFNGPNAEYLANRMNAQQWDDQDSEMAFAGNYQKPSKFKEGGSITLPNWLVEVDINNLSLEFRGQDIEEVSLDNILPEFKEGGKFNLIPEGALHARKHNMDVEGITPKGIPVVSQSEGGELEQQAEIEREEIIFRLEVTKKLEELAKDGSDEAAIEAGKLLVEEILYNTIDNTNNLIV